MTNFGAAAVLTATIAALALPNSGQTRSGAAQPVHPAASQPPLDELRTIAPAVYARMEKLCRGRDGLSKEELIAVANGEPFKGDVFRTRALVGVSGNKAPFSLGWSYYEHWDFGKISVDWIVQHSNRITSEGEATKYTELAKTHDFLVTWRVVDSKGARYFEDWYKPGQKRYSFAVRCEVAKVDMVKKEKIDIPTSQAAPDELMKLAPKAYDSLKKLCQGRESLTPAELGSIANGNLFAGLVLKTEASLDVTVGSNESVRWTHYVTWQFDKIQIAWVLHNATPMSSADVSKYLTLAKDHRFLVTWKVIPKVPNPTYFEGWYPGQKRYSFVIWCDVNGVEIE